MARFRACSDCGRRIRGNYTRCYRCNERRRRGHWHDPEHLEGLEERDVELSRDRFYVYVLRTDYGHYVGHTANVRARLGAHTADQVESTAGGEPQLLWTSYAFPTRREAARFEAALKSLRDQRSERFTEITGLKPIPFVPTRSVPKTGYAPRRPVDRRNGGCGLLNLLAICATVLAITLVFVIL